MYSWSYICEKSRNAILRYVLLNYLLYVNCFGFFLLLLKCYNLVVSGDECSRGTLSGIKPIHHSSPKPSWAFVRVKNIIRSKSLYFIRALNWRQTCLPQDSVKAMCVNWPQIMKAQLHINKLARSARRTGKCKSLIRIAKRILPTKTLLGEVKQRRLRDLSCWERWHGKQ